MITGITHVTRYVPSYDQALEFYRDLLGMQVVSDNFMGQNAQRWLTVSGSAQSGVELVLQVPSDWLNGAQLEAAERTMTQQPSILLSTDDIEGVLEKLKVSGAQLRSEVIGSMPWGRDLAFKDPFGNDIYLVQPHSA
jgi:catechol 2,3-dioxygenase-like lactoylglutathione lyase family enzyme